MTVYVVMGVSGSGKSTVGELIARKLGAHYAEGDSFHPPENVEKMRGGHPLNDDDRAPWLEAMAAAIRAWNARGETVVLSCSALKRRYRDVLRTGGKVQFIHFAGDKDLIAGRLTGRKGHYMPPSLLDSQFAALEPPGEDEAITIGIDGTPEEIAARALDALSSRAERGIQGNPGSLAPLGMTVSGSRARVPGSSDALPTGRRRCERRGSRGRCARPACRR